MKPSAFPLFVRIMDPFLMGTLILLSWGIIAMVGLLIYTSVKPSGALPSGLHLVAEVNATLPGVNARAWGENNITLSAGNTRLSVPLNGAPWLLRASTVLGTLGLLGLTWGIAAHLRGFVRSLRGTHPFVAENAARLRRIAWFTVGLCLWLTLSDFALASQVSHYVHAEGVSFQSGLEWKLLVTGLGLFVIAQVFRIGVAMKEEQDLTI